MSRKCPKRHHLLLNWLKENRTRFSYQPYVSGIRNNFVDIQLQGLQGVLKIDCYCSLSPESCCWISVNIALPGKSSERIINFYGAEVKSGNGWITLREPEDERRCWQTREALWIELCYEAFLSWCNTELSANRWLRFYEYSENSEFFPLAGVSLCKDESEAHALTVLETELIEDGFIDKENSEYLTVSLFNSSRSRNGAENEAGI